MAEKPEFRGRGAQFNTANKFLQRHIGEVDGDFLDMHPEEDHRPKTKFFYENPKTVVNKVTSPDVGMEYSLNPYQGCEHGCIYCYARNSHEYWGYSAGVDFESRIIIKENAPELLSKKLESPKWKPYPIVFSGNTDCYQPIERKLQITRKLLEVMLEYKHPVSIITKNALVMRDVDIISELAKMKLVKVMISITSLDENIRQKLEPRTATASQKLKAIETLSNAGVYCGVMAAPVIPGLTDQELPSILKAAGEAGAKTASYIIVRLNGVIDQLFTDWVQLHFPDRAQKILNQIATCHDGKLNDSRWGTRMKGSGNYAEIIKQMFQVARKKHIPQMPFEYDLSLYRRKGNGQLDLFS